MKLSKKIFSQYLEPDEDLLAVFHRHPFVIFPELATITFFGYLLPIFLYFLFPQLVLFFVFWLCISIFRLFYVLAIWYHDSILVTSVSLVDVHWHGFFKRSSNRLEYHMIEGVAYDILGFIKTVFNYGDISIKTTGGGIAIILKSAMNPQKIERQILAHQEKFVSSQSMQDAEALKSLLTTLIRNHIKNDKNSSNQ
jgi:hypothetical protein